jgi:hypothetical protein
MKRLSSFAVVLLLAVSGLFLAAANQSGARQPAYSHQDYGVLRMKHSPVLGMNIAIAVSIDGVQSGAFTKGHVYERRLTPGRHTIYASRPSRESDSWYGTLDVRPGQTYSFVVKCTVNQVYLIPVNRID